MQMPAAQRNGTWEIMRDAYNPGDLTITGDFQDGDLKKVSMMVSKDAAKGTADLIEYDGTTLMVNGKPATPPLTTENGTKITMEGGKFHIETKGGDTFNMEPTICPAINLEGDVNPNRGTGNVRSQLLGDFDDDPNSTWVTNADAQTIFGAGGATGGPAGGGGVGGAGGVGGTSAILDSIFESLRKVFSALASSGDAGSVPPGPGADFMNRVKSPELKAAIFDKAKSGGGIDVDKLVATIKDPAEREKVLLALTHGHAPLEDVIKSISKPEERLAFLTELVGPAKATELNDKLFAPAPVIP